MLLIGLIFFSPIPKKPANLATGVHTACAAKFSFKKNNDLKNLYFWKIPFHTYCVILEMWWLIGGDVVARWLEMWGLIVSAPDL